MQFEIYHKTEFVYQNTVTFSHNIARLTPKNNAFQTLEHFSMHSAPIPFEESSFVDIYGNNNTHLLIRKAHSKLSVTGKSVVSLDPEKIDAHIAHIKTNSCNLETARKRLGGFTKEDIYAKPFLFPSPLIPNVSENIKTYAKASFAPQRDLFEATYEFMERIFNDFTFVSGFSDVTTPIEEIFEAKKGVCQDFAQFAISALRAIGLPARYVSGYIETLPPEGKEKLFGADASHAWFSLYIPGAGWIDFDPTNNCIPRHQHILLGYGRDYLDIAPLKGVVLSSGESKLNVEVDVRQANQS